MASGCTVEVCFRRLSRLDLEFATHTFLRPVKGLEGDVVIQRPAEAYRDGGSAHVVVGVGGDQGDLNAQHVRRTFGNASL